MTVKMFGANICVKYFKGEGKEPEHNWKVFAGELMIGYLHDCSSIGGYIWDEDFMNSDEFEKVCAIAEEDLKNRSI